LTRRRGGGDGGEAVTDQVWAKVDELAASLQGTDAYRALQAARQQVEEREAARIMLRDLQRLQEEIEEKQASGEPVDQELMDRLQQRLQLVALNPYVREYLQAEAAFAQLLIAVQVRLAEKLGLPAGGAGAAPAQAGSPEGGGEARQDSQTPPPRPRSSRLWVPG